MTPQSLPGSHSARITLPAAVTFVLLCVLSAACLMAGGPFASGVIPGEGFTRWNPNQPVGYLVDPGPFNNTQDNAFGRQLVDEAFARWNSIASATLTAQNQGQLPVNVTAANFQNFLGQANQPVAIIFDQDGTIIDAVFGAGASGQTLGFASPTNANAQNEYTSGFIVLNGPAGQNNPGFSQTVAHELGHVLGLDHTQVNRRFEAQAPQRQFVPLMYPFALPGQGADPELDDAAWFSFIYPAPGFSDQFGEIRGRALRANGLPMQSGHVTAAQVQPAAGGLLELSDDQVVGAVAEFQLNGDGRFVLPGLPPGDYVVFIEPIDSRFTQGSSVGPFDESSSRQRDYLRDFFNGAAESAADDPLEASVITIEAGQTVGNVDIIVNNVLQIEEGTVPVILNDDDFRFFDFPEGFAFPFFGRVYGQMLIHSDGNITFIQDDASFDPRSVARLVLAPPRIAPFFTDLNPEAGGSVQVVISQDSLRVEWNDVPEFSLGVPPPGNTFSVTLRTTGEVQFDYQQISASADGDPGDPALIGVVGVSPGYLATELPAAETDLSLAGDPVPLGNAAVLEGFRGPGSFDLTGAPLVFQPDNETFVFPFLQADALSFTGLAAANVSEGDAAVTLENFLDDGSSAAFDDNPASDGLFQDDQFARVSNELFDIPAQTEQGGWVRMISSRPELASFFQFGNGLSGNPTTQLDGGVALRQDETGDVIFFSRVLQGPVFLTPGAQVEAETVFSIINPSDEEIEIEARYFRTTGVNDFNPAMRVIPPRGAIRETFPQLFGNTPPLMDGYVRVDLVRGSQVTGFQLIRLPDSVFGLNSFQAGEVNTIYSAQLANGGGQGVFSFTNLNLVNTSDQLLEVTITAVDENGMIINVPQIVAINPNASLQRDASEFFGLGLPSSAAVRTGSIIVEADQAGLVGDVIFGDPVNFDTAASMQLQSQTFTEAYFSQVANNVSIFTGLAIFNPDTVQTAQVTIQVFDMTGNLVGETLLPLGPENRISQVLAVLVPEAANQVGGYIRLQSDVPIVAQELFGNNGVTFLSAVPPQAETP